MCAPAPEGVLKRCAVEAGFLAYMIIAKFLWHLPLHRQERMLQAQGIKLSRDTLIRYVIAVAALLKPLWEELRRMILEGERL